MPQALENSRCKGSSGKIMGKTWKSQHGSWRKVRNRNEVIAEARNEGRIMLWASLMDLCHLNSELEPQFRKYKRSGRSPRWYCESWFRIVCSIYWTRIITITNDGSKSNGYYIQTTRMRRTSSRRRIGEHPGQNGRCTDAAENSEICMDTSTTTKMAKIMHGPVWKTRSFVLNEICTVILWQDCYGKRNSRKFYGNNTVGTMLIR